MIKNSVNKREHFEDKRMKFVLFFPSEDYYYYPYFSIMNREDILIADPLIDVENKLIRFIRMIYSSRKITNIIGMPFKNLWIPLYYREPKSDDIIYFVFYGSAYSKLTIQYKRYLKKKYPHSKNIVFHCDLISKRSNICIKEQEEFADLIMTYDKGDADKYGFVYYPDVYTRLPSILLEGEFEYFDISFLGFSKDRLDVILGIYQHLLNHKIKCDFNIPDIAFNLKRQHIGLSDSGKIPYLEYIKRIQYTNCLLEIEQAGAVGYTLRTWEAIAYNKKLLTNNRAIEDAPFYNPRFIHVIQNIDEIDTEWIKEKIDVDYQYIDEVSPEKFLEFIRKYFES